MDWNAVRTVMQNMRMRKGYTPRNMMYLLGIAILSALFVGGGLEISTRLQDGAETEVSRIDAERFSNAFTLLGSEGSGVMQLESTNDYSRIAIEGKELVLDGDFLDDPLRRQLPRAFTYQEDAVSGGTLCIYKQGLRFSLGEPPCEPDTVACDGTVTMTGDTPGSGAIRSEGRCVYYERGGAPTYGWYCDNGQYTSQDFYERYYGGCSPQPDAFIEVNRLVCPDEGDNDALYGCYAAFSYRCAEGAGTASVTLTTPGDDATASPACTGDIEHMRVSQTFTATGPATVSVTATVPGGDPDYRQTTMETR